MRKCWAALIASVAIGCATTVEPDRPPPDRSSTGRWQIVTAPLLSGYGGPVTYLLDSATGQTWLQCYTRFENDDGRHTNVVYWQKMMAATLPTTVPANGTTPMFVVP